jgi:hypothetical protein
MLHRELKVTVVLTVSSRLPSPFLDAIEQHDDVIAFA